MCVFFRSCVPNLNFFCSLHLEYIACMCVCVYCNVLLVVVFVLRSFCNQFVCHCVSRTRKQSHICAHLAQHYTHSLCFHSAKLKLPQVTRTHMPRQTDRYKQTIFGKQEKSIEFAFEHCFGRNWCVRQYNECV